jgi:hypothetical protein
VGGSVEGPSDGRDGSEDVDDQHWFVESDDDAGRPGSDATNAGHHDQYAFSASPIRQWRRQWRHHRRRHHAQQPDQPDRGRSPVPVRHDAQCHSEGPLRRPSREVAQLRMAQVVVYRIARERRRGHLQPAAQGLVHPQ